MSQAAIFNSVTNYFLWQVYVTNLTCRRNRKICFESFDWFGEWVVQIKILI